MVSPAQTDRPDQARGGLSRANSIPFWGGILRELLRGGHLSHANLVRGAGGCYVTFWIKPTPQAMALLPDDGYEDALKTAASATGALSARALRMSRPMHRRVFRELARARLCTPQARGSAPVWTSTPAARQAWLKARSQAK